MDIVDLSFKHHSGSGENLHATTVIHRTTDDIPIQGYTTIMVQSISSIQIFQAYEQEEEANS